MSLQVLLLNLNFHQPLTPSQKNYRIELKPLKLNKLTIQRPESRYCNQA